MATSLKNLSAFEPDNIPNAKLMKFGIVVSEYNEEITLKLLEGCRQTLIKFGAKEENLRVIFVPGGFELTAGAHQFLLHEKFDAVICLGCVIQGDTKHDDYINQAVANGITNLNIHHHTPVIFGLLTTNNFEQAKERSGGKHGNKGVECAIAAIKMADLRKQLTEQAETP